MNIIAIGTCSDLARNHFTGQSVMFDGIVDSLSRNGEKVTVIDISSRLKSDSSIARGLDYVLVLIRLFWKLIITRYDVVYITSSQSKRGFLRDYMMISLCRFFKVKVITHQYGANYHQLTDALDKKGMKKLRKMLGYVSRIIVEGDYMKEQFSFLDVYKPKVVAIPNGLPIEGKHSQIAKEYDNQKPFVLFYLSNLIWSKGYFDVLKAVDILVNQEKMNVKCVFAGRFMSSVDDERPGISNKDDFDRFILDHDLKDIIEYHQGLYGEEKDDYFYKSNVFLLPTYYINEGQPVSVIEAMAYGCIPLVTDYRHIPMMVNEDNGCYVEPQNPRDIADKIMTLMTHPDVYANKSKRCITDYQQKFKFDVYAEKVLNCINAVIK